MYRPWHFAWDMNADGLFTISDVWLLIKQVFYLPGDSLLFLILVERPGTATFLELSTANSHGFLTGVDSAISWIVLFVGSLMTYAAWDIHRTARETTVSAKRRTDRLKRLGYDDYSPISITRPCAKS